MEDGVSLGLPSLGAHKPKSSRRLQPDSPSLMAQMAADPKRQMVAFNGENAQQTQQQRWAEGNQTAAALEPDSEEEEDSRSQQVLGGDMQEEGGAGGVEEGDGEGRGSGKAVQQLPQQQQEEPLTATIQEGIIAMEERKASLLKKVCPPSTGVLLVRG